MAYIGLKHPVFAPIATEPAGSLPTYGTGLVVGKALIANVAIELGDSKLAADDTIAETDNSFNSGTITMGVDDLSDEALQAWLGQKKVNVDGVEVIRSAANYEAPAGGFGYYRVRKKNGIRSYRAYWYHKTQWGMPSEDAATKPDGSIEWQTPEVEGTIMTAQDADCSWRDSALFNSEADAIAWLDAKAGLPVSASDGLSALSLAGEGGTISPAFDADVRYYTFGGVTAESVTVTATAADHTLKLYINGTYVQDLESGEASDAITFAGVGAKKLTIVAQEANKASQTTEIIVVKTA